MKKILPALAVLFFLLTNCDRLAAQVCNDLKSDWDKAEQKDESLAKKISALKELIAILENPESGLNTLAEEIKDAEKQAAALQKKIAAGDNSAETSNELKTVQANIALMKQRDSKDFNEAIFFNDPKFKQLETSLGKLNGDEIETKRQITDLERQMNDAHCPKPVKKKDDFEEIDLSGGNWGGPWKAEDPKNRGAIITLSLNGSGSSTTGSTSYPLPDGLSAVNKITGCKETGTNKLFCNYNSTMEDEEAKIDVVGTVELILTVNTITSNWKESASAKVTWKRTPRNVQPIPPRSYTIVFKRG